MAEAVVTVLLEKLSSLFQKELGSITGVDEELKKLSSTFTAIHAVLADAEMKQFTDLAIKDWLRKVEDVALLLDDILDEFSTHDLQNQNQQQKGGWFNKIHAACHSSFGLKNAMFRRRMANKMKRMRETLQNIAEERKMFHLCERIATTDKKAELMEWRQTSSVITQPEIYGREEDKERVVQALIQTCDTERAAVHTIVGLGGLGKTTLAQLVFNDDRITMHFDLKIWVCVSEDFSLKRMIKAILDSASVSVSGNLDIDPLQKKLQQALQGKRYLLVLDDIWSEDQEKWDRLKNSLVACGSKVGSSILVTTRLTKVASIMGTLPPHDLSFLSDEDCWSLFKQRAFGLDEGENVELVAIGKEIVKKCKGLPLAAKSLGGLLRFKREEREWLYVKDNEIWNLPQDENSILPALRLSYLNLPLKSRQCFSFCAIFPKDAWIEKDELVHLWMANGFVSSEGTMTVEDVAEEIISELCWASFFQDIEKDYLGKVRCFKIHDLLHDLAQYVMGDLCCIVNDEMPIEHPKRIRHLTMGPCARNQIISACTFRSLRTFHFRQTNCALASTKILGPLESLRALDLGYVNVLNMLHFSLITHFKHLRYLNLSGTSIQTLTESTSSLCNLQVLNLSYCRSLRRLPRHLKYLKALRHLYLRGCSSLVYMPNEIGQLNSLRTLNIYIVGKKKGLRLDELAQLCLRGELHIKNLERVTNAADAKEANLMGKQLDVLKLSWGRNEQSKLLQNVDQILEALEPHPKLIDLGVGGYQGMYFPQWMGNPHLKNLCSIKLVDCWYSQQLPLLGRLPSLKILAICCMHNLRYVDDESYDGGVARGFQSLMCLELCCMPNLEGLSKEEGGDMFPGLSKMNVIACPRLTFPALPSVRKLCIAKGRRRSGHDLFSREILLSQCPSTTRSPNQVQMDSIHSLSCLEILEIHDEQELASFPKGTLQGLCHLRQLHIHHQSKMEVLPLELANNAALQELHIIGCHNLESLTDQVLTGLQSLQKLKIFKCDKFKGLSTGFQSLSSLKDLIISFCPQMVALAEDLQHMPPMLQSITLHELKNLECLPYCWGSTMTLQSLYIACCPKLKSLPISVGWFNGLNSLTVVHCPSIQKQFEKETGKDWKWIKHIPNVDLGENCWVIPTIAASYPDLTFSNWEGI
ncbi:putative disease resistance protein RGA3 isoform X1 [Arachis stenosperma]|uniref:putative disease resistance protein RGA3 isoform X1 n=1 Tax=Arachis stenosperma TaxID=217475 RepID=UPI0025AC94BF|nr:putative disease resistance protein RGA3 isoform X1 [Arachis stenosperma]